MKRLVQIAVGLVAVLVLVVGGVALFFDANQFRPLLESELTKALGRDVKVGDLKLALLKGSVTAGDLSIADDPKFSPSPFVKAKSLNVGVELRPLLFDRKLNVTGITIDQPEINLIESAPGEWNFASIGSKEAKPATTEPAAGKSKLDLSVKLIKITGGRMSLVNRKSPGESRTFEKVDITVRDFSPTAAIPFQMSADTRGAHVNLEGKVGPLAEKDAAMTPVDAAIKLTNLDLSESGFVDKSTGIDGLVAVEGTVNSTGVSVVTKGKIKAERLKLARQGTPAKRTVEFDFTVGHNVKKESGILTAGAVHIGAAKALINGDYSLEGKVPVVHFSINGPKMEISELVEMLPPMAVVLPSGSSLKGGHASVKLDVEGPLDRLVITGPLSVNDTKLANFDLGSKLRTIATLAGVKIAPDTDIKTLSLKVKNSIEGTDVADLLLDVPTIGQLTGAGTVSPKNDLDFKMRVALHNSGGVLQAIGGKGDTTVPLFVRGTASNPSFVPDVKGMATEKVQSVLKSDKLNKALEGSEAGKAAKGLLDSLLSGKKQK